MKSCSASFVLVAINARSLVPDYGRLTQTRLPHSAPAVSPLYPPPPWKLPGARVLKLLFETDVDPVLTWLPPKLSRSSPPYAIITAAQFPQSPVGPFSLAAQYIGCRAGFFIRALTLQAVCDTAPALAALREVWGYPCTPGQLELEEKDGGAIAYITSGGSVLAQLSLTGPSDIDADAVRFDPVLNIRSVPSLEDGKTHELLHMVQIDPDNEIKQSVRGAGSIDYARSAWGILPVRNMISAVYCTMDTELPLARFTVPY